MPKPPSTVTPTSSSPCSANASPVAASPSEGAAMETNPSASPQTEVGVEVEVDCNQVDVRDSNTDEPGDEVDKDEAEVKKNGLW